MAIFDGSVKVKFPDGVLVLSMFVSDLAMIRSADIAPSLLASD